MFRRFQAVKTKNLFPRRGKWLFLLVIVLLFALVATTAAQEEAVDDESPPVLEPFMIDRTVTPQGVDEVWTFFPSQDAFLSSARPYNNYGNLSTLGVGYDTSIYQAMRTVMQFNITSIPSNSIVNSARLELYQSGCDPNYDVDMGLLAQFMKSSWTEYGVTWANANYLGGDQIGVGNATCVLGWKTFDATNVVREWISGARPNYGFIITGHEGTDPPRTRTYSSREQAGLEPKLTIDFNGSCDNVAPTAWVEALPQWSKNEGTVSWTGTDSAPSGCTPVGIRDFDVEYNINGGSWTLWQQNTTATSAAFSSGQNGQTYYLRARATDNAGNVQAWPSSPQASTTIDSVAPQAQMNALPQYSLGPNFQISWDGSDNAGGSGIATYDVQFKEGDGDWINYVTGTTAKSATFGPAQNGVTYSFRARATDVAGNIQPWSEDAQTSTTAVNHPVAIVTPFNPIIMNPTAPVTTSFTVKWQGFTLSGVTISQYQLQYNVNNGPWTFWDDFPGTQFSAEFTDLVAQDSTYYFEARALTNALDVEDEQFNNVPEALKVVDLQAPFFEPTIYSPMIEKDGD
jgi:hypothetical protein